MEGPYWGLVRWKKTEDGDPPGKPQGSSLPESPTQRQQGSLRLLHPHFQVAPISAEPSCLPREEWRRPELGRCSDWSGCRPRTLDSQPPPQSPAPRSCDPQHSTRLHLARNTQRHPQGGCKGHMSYFRKSGLHRAAWKCRRIAHPLLRGAQGLRTAPPTPGLRGDGLRWSPPLGKPAGLSPLLTQT